LASVRVWDGCALCVQPAQTGTVSPDGAGAKRQLHRINSPADGESIPLNLLVSQIFISAQISKSRTKFSRPVEWGLEVVCLF